MRLVFMGTPDFAARALAALITAGHEIVWVYTQPPRPAHRGKHLSPSAVHRLAQSHGLAIRTPQSLRDPHSYADLIDIDCCVVAAYGLIIPAPMLAIPRLGCLNIHASLLPRWRGAAPIQRALMAGDAETGICIMRMEAGLDTGPVLLRHNLPLHPDDTFGSVHDKLAALGSTLIVEALERLDSLEAQAQPHEGISYAHKITAPERRLSFHQEAHSLERLVRSLHPSPGAYFECGETRIKVLHAVVDAAPSKTADAVPGTVCDERLGIMCADGLLLRPTLVQQAGKNPVPTADFLRGFSIQRGDLLA